VREGVHWEVERQNCRYNAYGFAGGEDHAVLVSCGILVCVDAVDPPLKHPRGLLGRGCEYTRSTDDLDSAVPDGLPASVARVKAKSSPRSLRSAAALRRIALRLFKGVPDQASRASLAARTASFTSSFVPLLIISTTLPEPGLMRGTVSAFSTFFPFITRPTVIGSAPNQGVNTVIEQELGSDARSHAATHSFSKA